MELKLQLQTTDNLSVLYLEKMKALADGLVAFGRSVDNQDLIILILGGLILGLIYAFTISIEVVFHLMKQRVNY